MKRPRLQIPAAATLSALVFLTGCGALKKGKKDDGAGEGTDRDRDRRTAAEAAFYEECGTEGGRGGTITGRDGWLFSAAELLQVRLKP